MRALLGGRRLRFVIIALVFSVLVACGGGDRGGGGGREPATPPTSTASRFSGAGSEEFCRLSRAYAEASARVDPSVTDADVPRIFRDANRDVAAAASMAPDEIRADVRTVADGFAALVSALEGVGFDFSRLSPELIAQIESPEFTAASDRVLAYTRDVCGIRG